MSAAKQEKPPEPTNMAGKPFFPGSVTLLACPQCIEARLWPLNCGHNYVEFFAKEYLRADLPAAGERVRELEAEIANWEKHHKEFDCECRHVG